jgi:hypothetical protein
MQWFHLYAENYSLFSEFPRWHSHEANLVIMSQLDLSYEHLTPPTWCVLTKMFTIQHLHYLIANLSSIYIIVTVF